MRLLRVVPHAPSQQAFWGVSSRGACADGSFRVRRVRDPAALELAPLQWMQQLGSTSDGLAEEEEDVHESRCLAPVPGGVPPVLLAVGLNYRNHAQETKMELPKFPIVIGKSPTAVVGHRHPIRIPRVVSPDETDFEVELGVVLGKPTRDVSPKHALEYVLGFTVVNDVSARKWQGKTRGGGQWTRAKSFDTFAPMGPCIRLMDGAAGSSLFDPTNAKLTSRLKKRGAAEFELMQSDSTRNLIFGVAELVSFMSQGTTLPSWSVIATGTPAGVGYTREPPVFLEDGDEIEVAVDGIGVLCNPVEREVA